jgi:hypothetical protein
MKSLENFLTLIVDGRPTTKRIDDKIDEFVEYLVDKVFSGSDSKLKYLLFNEESRIYEKDDFLIVIDKQHYDSILDDITTSMQRYKPFLNFHPQFDRENMRYRYQSYFKIPMVLEITPEMKKSMILEKNLDKNLKRNKGITKKQTKV